MELSRYLQCKPCVSSHEWQGRKLTPKSGSDRPKTNTIFSRKSNPAAKSTSQARGTLNPLKHLQLATVRRAQYKPQKKKKETVTKGIVSRSLVKTLLCPVLSCGLLVWGKDWKRSSNHIRLLKFL